MVRSRIKLRAPDRKAGATFSPITVRKYLKAKNDSNIPKIQLKYILTLYKSPCATVDR